MAQHGPSGVAKPAFHDERMGFRPVLLALFLCVLWGGLGPALKISLEGIPPLAAAGWRFLLGLMCILGWCLLHRIEWWPPAGHQGTLLVYGLIFALQISVFNLGTHLISSNHSVVLLNTYPLFSALLAHFLIPNDRLNRKKMAGLLVAFLGVGLIFMGSPSRVIIGDWLVLASGFLLGVILVYSKFLVERLTPFQVPLWQMIYGVPIFFLLSFFWEQTQSYRLTVPVLAGLLYQGIVVSGFCFVVLVQLLQRHAVSRVTVFQFSTPVFGVVFSWLTLGEFPSGNLAFGVVLVGGGIYLISTVPVEAIYLRSEKPDALKDG